MLLSDGREVCLICPTQHVSSQARPGLRIKGAPTGVLDMGEPKKWLWGEWAGRNLVTSLVGDDHPIQRLHKAPEESMGSGSYTPRPNGP